MSTLIESALFLASAFAAISLVNAGMPFLGGIVGAIAVYQMIKEW